MFKVNENNCLSTFSQRFDHVSYVRKNILIGFGAYLELFFGVFILSRIIATLQKSIKRTFFTSAFPFLLFGKGHIKPQNLS